MRTLKLAYRLWRVCREHKAPLGFLSCYNLAAAFYCAYEELVFQEYSRLKKEGVV